MCSTAGSTHVYTLHKLNLSLSTSYLDINVCQVEAAIIVRRYEKLAAVKLDSMIPLIHHIAVGLSCKACGVTAQPHVIV